MRSNLFCNQNSVSLLDLPSDGFGYGKYGGQMVNHDGHVNRLNNRVFKQRFKPC